VAGKITGPAGGPPSAAPAGGPPVARDDAKNDKRNNDRTGDAWPVAAERAPFAEKLKPAGAPTSTTAQATAPTGNVVADLPAELQASKAPPGSAVARVIDQVIGRVVDSQLGAKAPAALREKLRTALEEAVADDPLLASKLRG
jgi:hypothetical protein